MHSPREPHLQAVKLILWYLKGTLGYGLWFPKTTFPLLLKVFSDADGVGCSWDRRSTGGFCIFLGSCLVSLSAKKQHTVARSSTEAEYRSLAHTLAEITWICQLLTDIGFQLPSLPQIWCDNVSAIALASNPVFHARTKHVEIDYHYIRELVLAKLLTVQIVCNADQLAVIHTKSLPRPRFLQLRSKLSLQPSPFSFRGCEKQVTVVKESSKS
ncbi:hypothetical protein ACFX19_040742 [Malus domestica]